MSGIQSLGGSGRTPASLLSLKYPMSLAVYDDYTQAQKAVDYLSDNDFPVQNCMIVGTDLKQVERVTGRLTWGKVAAGGALSGIWMGLFVGVVLSLFNNSSSDFVIIGATVLFGALFGLGWALAGYAATSGSRDFTSVTQVLATRYEVLVEHKFAQQGRDLLAKLPPDEDPFSR